MLGFGWEIIILNPTYLLKLITNTITIIYNNIPIPAIITNFINNPEYLATRRFIHSCDDQVMFSARRMDFCVSQLNSRFTYR